MAVETTTGLTTDLIVQGAVGLALAGVFIRQFLQEWRKARVETKPQNPIVTAVAIGWQADQIERVVQALEEIADAAQTYESSAKDSARQGMDRLLKRLDEVEEHYVERSLKR